MTISKAQTIVAVVLLFGCVFAFAGGLILPIANVFERQWALIAEAEQRLALVYSRRKDADSLEDHRRTLESEVSRDAGFIVAHSESDARQRFQQRLRSLMTNHKVQMGSMRSLPTAREGETIALRLEASMRIPIDRIAGFIRTLEAMENSLFLERLQLRKDSGANVLATTATLRAYAIVESPPRTSQ